MSLPFSFVAQSNSHPKKTEYLYQVSLIDSSEMILSNIFVNDSCNNEIKSVKYRFSNRLTVDEQLPDNRVVEEIEYRKITYIDNCRPKTVKLFDRKMKEFKRFIYLYDANGNQIELTITDATGNQISRYTYEYDNFNNLTKKVRYDRLDKQDHVSLIEYSEGLRIKETRLNVGLNDTVYCLYRYNANHQLVSEEWYSSDECEVEFYYYIYDGQNKVREIYFDSSDAKESREYRMTYYNNGLEKTWSEYDLYSGRIKDRTYSSYEFQE